MNAPRGEVIDTGYAAAVVAVRTGIPLTEVVIVKQGESFVLDPHVTGECLITFDEQGAKALRDILTEWLE